MSGHLPPGQTPAPVIVSAWRYVGVARLRSTSWTVAHRSLMLSACRQRLRSATQQLMEVPRHRLTTVGRRAFAVHGPMVWNSLPDDLRAQQDYESFRQGLKTWLFSRYYSPFRALETFVIIALYKSTFTIPYHTIVLLFRVIRLGFLMLHA